MTPLDLFHTLHPGQRLLPYILTRLPVAALLLACLAGIWSITP